MVLWHVGAVGWLLNVDYGIFAILANSIIYSVPFMLTTKINKKYKLLFFIALWLLFELSINVYSYATPLLTIGNAMSNQVYLIQWYKYANVLAGSFWLLLIAYFIVKLKIKTTILIFSVPIICSAIIFFSNKTVPNKSATDLKILTFNPEYFIKKNKSQKELMVYLKNKLKKHKKYDLLILPEATINFNLTAYKKSMQYKELKNLVSKNNSLLVGATIPYGKDKINATFLLTQKESLLKVKKKLVPYTENLPNFMKKWYEKSFFLTNIKDETKSIVKKFNFTPLICYEAFFPFYVTNFQNSKAILLNSSERFLNDSYYGKRFYNNILKLRAIENNKLLLKCTNFGNALLINQKGIIIDASNNKEFHRFNLPLNSINLNTTP